jgi:alkylhydroperoxidase/carboxymuconolactone decarboxylase family protein YurZ
VRQLHVSAEHLDPQTVQFIMFAILLFDRDDDAVVHARIASKLGASMEQLLDVVKLAGWLGGAQAFNGGFRALEKVRQEVAQRAHDEPDASGSNEH